MDLSMTGSIEQINISSGGVPKLPIPEAQLTHQSITGDFWAHPAIHGGPRQTVLLIAAEVIEQLQGRGFPVFPGALGENLTTRGLDWRQWRAGQRYRVGSQVWIELTKPRGPCATLDVYNTNDLRIQTEIYDKQVKAGDPSTPRWGMSGFYARVIEPGQIRTNDIISLVDQAV